MKKPKINPGDRFNNRHVEGVFRVLPEKHERGGLYVWMVNEKTGERSTFHRSNLVSCFTKITEPTPSI